MDDIGNKQAVQPSGILSKSLTTEEWVAGILIMNPTLIGIMSERVSDADFTDPISRAVFQSVVEIVGDDGRDPIDFADRLAKTMGKRGVDAIALQTLCDRVINKIARAVEVEDAEIWSGYLQDESSKRRSDERLAAVDRRLDAILTEYRRGNVELSEVGAVMRTASETLQADGEGEVKGADGFNFIPADEIPGSPDTEWLLNGYIPRGGIVLLAGSPKGGKTTLARLMLKTCGEGGGFIGRHIKPMKVLVVSEESPRLWKRFVSEMGIGNHVSFLFQPFKGKPTLPEFVKLVDAICRQVRANKIDLVILDTWSHLSPCNQENDAAEMEASLAPLRRIPEAEAGLLLLHHTRKSGGEHGSGIRGSSALAGFADINLELSRMPGDAGDDTRRTLRATSRFEETPAEVVIEKRGADYVMVGSTADARRLDDISVIREILIAGPDTGMTRDEIHGQWPTDDNSPKRPSKTGLFNLLRSGVERAIPVWNKSGTGHRGDAIRYSFIHLKRGNLNESIEENNPKDSFIQNPLLRLNESINGESDQYGTKNGNSRITNNGLCKTTTNGLAKNGYSDPGDCPF